MRPIAWPGSQLGLLLHQLERHYGTPAAPHATTPFEMILWEIVAYLAADDRRRLAFEALREKVGETPDRILAAPPKLLSTITRLGGPIAADERAERLRKTAHLAVHEYGGDLANLLKLPPPKAKKALMRFPMIGEPGAEKILLFSGVLSVLALESNGLRVVVRLGIGEDRNSYAATYKSVREATMEQLPADGNLLTTAHLLLRQHGRQICLRTEPACPACPVRSDCRYFQRQK